MPLFEQKYQNNIRTISGLVNPVFPDDVTLLCDTSGGAVNIQLQPIPYKVLNPLDPPNLYAGFYNTQYQLCVVDFTGNSTVNNITVQAPFGFTINGQPSVTLASNGASYYIVISSQTNYLALYGGVISGTNPLLISLTNAALLALINSNSVVAGQFYLVTDALDTDGGVIVQGDAINGSSVNGTGLYYDADYQGVGNYTGVVGFGTTKGIWYTPTPPNPAAPPLAAGDVVIYDNQHYVNLTNAWWDGINPPSSDAVNWQLLAKSPTNGYIRACDQVRYNVNANRVIYRADRRGNEVDWIVKGGQDSIKDFQWGRDAVLRNKLKDEGYMVCTNSYCFFIGNELSNGAGIFDSTGANFAGSGTISFNRLDNGSNISTTRVLGQITNNHLSGGSNISTSIIANTGTINFNSLRNGSQITANNTTSGFIRNNDLDTDSAITTNGVDSASNINNNELSNQSLILTNSLLQTVVRFNRLYTQAKIEIQNGNELTMEYNMLSATGSFVIEGNMPPALIKTCEVSDMEARYRLLNEDLIGKKARIGFSNFALVVITNSGFSPITTYFLPLPIGALVINTLYNKHIGIFYINRLIGGQQILTIQNLPLTHPVTFLTDFNGGGAAANFITTPVFLVGADVILSNLPAPASIQLLSPLDTCVMTKNIAGGANVITEINVLQ